MIEFGPQGQISSNEGASSPLDPGSPPVTTSPNGTRSAPCREKPDLARIRAWTLGIWTSAELLESEDQLPYLCRTVLGSPLVAFAVDYETDKRWSCPEGPMPRLRTSSGGVAVNEINERRANRGIASVVAGCVDNVDELDAETLILDTLAQLAHLIERCGLFPDVIFDKALIAWAGDLQDGPPAKAMLDPTAPLLPFKS